MTITLGCAAMGAVIAATVAIAAAIIRHDPEHQMRGPLPAHDQGVPYDRRKWRAAMKSWHAPAAGQDVRTTGNPADRNW